MVHFRGSVLRAPTLQLRGEISRIDAGVPLG